MVTIHTAQYGYAGPDRLDITVKGGDALGMIFAPEWLEVKKYLYGPHAKTKQAEMEYATAYKTKMLLSHSNNRRAWDELLARDRVVLVCFCKAGAFCHRQLLKQYLVAMGATDGGEI